MRAERGMMGSGNTVFLKSLSDLISSNTRLKSMERPIRWLPAMQMLGV